ncbi:MAG TPA: histidine kinase [Geobacteraceae bacterium]|nr:histidine kinase [Geobacteraceae bacterium]
MDRRRLHSIIETARAEIHPEGAFRPGKRYVPKTQVEHLIATGRLVLASFFLMAIWLDPSEPSHFARLTYVILACYLAYSLVLGVATWRRNLIRGHLQIVTHGIDLLAFSTLMFLTEGPNSPFFVYFIFLLVCSTLRWQWRGTLWSAVVTLSVVVALALLPSNLLHDHNFELNRFIIRVVYLAVVAILLGYLGAHEQSMRDVLTMLAEWPRTVSEELQAMTQQMLEHAATILDVPRILLVWEEEEEPWLHLVLWSQGGWHYTREHPGAFGTLVAEQLAGTSFFCRDAGDPHPQVVHNSPAGLQGWKGAPLQQQLQERFDIGSVCVSELKGEKMMGYLMALDKKSMTVDDLVLGEIVAHEVAARFDNYFLLKELKQAATSDAQIRMARDLHDGLLQTLAGAALQLEAAVHLMDTEHHKARQCIQETQLLLAAEQRALRTLVNELKPGTHAASAEEFCLASRLEDLTGRIMRQWGIPVEIKLPSSPPLIPRNLSREIYFVVHEALINAVRHAAATELHAELFFEANNVHITVTDNGQGFSFHGRYDHDALCAMKRGPVTLRERINDLKGTLSIDSKQTGSRLDITLPLAEYGG